MNDHDLRTAFRHLEEDVINNVQTEHRLEQITRRHTWVRPILVSVASAAAVVILVGGAILALRPTPTDTIPPATNTTATPPTSVPGTTAGTTTVPETAGGLDLSNDTWVMQTPSGITTPSGGVVFETMPTPGMPNIARDHAGGIAFVDNSGLWWWQAGGNQPQLVSESEPVASGEMIEVIPTEQGPVAHMIVWDAELTDVFINLATGAQVDAVSGNVTIAEDRAKTITVANGLSAMVTQPDVSLNSDGFVDEVIEPAHLVIERDGAAVLDLRIGSGQEAWARLHDFDGQHVIVSVGPYEPAAPPETYYVIDLACADCTTSFIESGTTAALTGPDVNWNGTIANFGADIEATATSLLEVRHGTAIVADPSLASTGAPGEIATVAVDDTTLAVGADRAIGDLSGGLFVQIGDTIAWVRRDGPVVDLLSGDDLVESGIVELELEDVAVVNDAVNVLFSLRGGQGEQSYGEVWRYDVDTGTPTLITHFGLADGDMTRASLQNRTLVLTFQAEGYSWFRFYDLNGDPIDINNPKPDTGDYSIYVDQGTLTAGAEALVYLESEQLTPSVTGEWPVDIVVRDLATGRELHRIPLELGTAFPDRLDYDGSDVVLGLRRSVDGEWQREAPIRISVDTGGISQIDVTGIPSLSK